MTAGIRSRASVLLVALSVVWPAFAQPTDPADGERQADAMAQTVLDQLAAFRRGDWATAYGFASAGIQAQFDLEAFREMVTRGYAAIADSVSATVLRTVVEPLQPRGYVEIRVQGKNGETIDAVYELIQEQGAWKINAVVSAPARERTSPTAHRLGRRAASAA